MLGEYCYFTEKSCHWYIAINTSCEKGVVSPILGNTDKGAASLEMLCVGSRVGKLYQYEFRNWKSLEGLIKSGSRVGFAMPMQEDQFTVHRFLLDGLAKATIDVETDFSAAVSAPNTPKSRPVNSTKTEVL